MKTGERWYSGAILPGRMTVKVSDVRVINLDKNVFMWEVELHGSL